MVVLLLRVRLLQLLLGVLGVLLLLLRVVVAVRWVGVGGGVWLTRAGVAHGPCPCCCSTCLLPSVRTPLLLRALGRLLPATYDAGC